MTSATNAAAAKVTKPKKVSHAKTADNAELPFPTKPQPEFGMMPLESIVVLEQVREVFSDGSLAELAEDIATRGILQPLTVRQEDGKYILIAGERRLRAARLARLESVPVLIANVSAADHAVTQLAENIQREELCLAEEAKAVKILHEKFGNLADVAKIVHKSLPWVSKRLAAANPGLSWPAARLIEGGKTEDLELVLTVDKVCKIDNYEGTRLGNLIAEGNAGRETAREKLAEVKRIAQERQEAHEARIAMEKDPERIAKIEEERKAAKEEQARNLAEFKQIQHVNTTNQMMRFWDWCAENEIFGSAWLETRDEAQLDALRYDFNQWSAAGSTLSIEELASRNLYEFIKAGNNCEAPSDHQMAMLNFTVAKRGFAVELSDFMNWYAERLIRPIQKETEEGDK